MERNEKGQFKRGHGQCFTRTYKSWESMKSRCDSPRYGCYPRYGGRGITYDERWKIFENFLSDMGERPEGTSLDRIDSNGNYTNENCRWASYKTQAINRRSTLFFERDGIRDTLTGWCRRLGLSTKTIYDRILKYGLTKEEAIFMKPRSRRVVGGSNRELWRAR